jgi:hypothetical protein
VKHFRRSGLRHIPFDEHTVLVEQNPTNSSEWAAAARKGSRIAWLLRDGGYIVEGDVVMFD